MCFLCVAAAPVTASFEFLSCTYALHYRIPLVCYTIYRGIAVSIWSALTGCRFGFVTVPSKADADALVKLFHGQTFHGKQLCVQLAYTHNDETNGAQSSCSSKVRLSGLLY